MNHHVEPVKSYFVIWVILIILTGTTLWVGELELGEWNVVVAVTIAVIKATLVALFFMHIKGSASITKIFVIAGLFWMSILFVLTLGDYNSRGWLPVGRFW
jgi:cytochrome c oxidase subunit IV